MPPFRFRLARVRRVRDIREEIARSELLASEAALRAAEQAAELARARLVEAHDAIEGLQRRSPVDPRSVLAADATVRHLTRRVRETQVAANVASVAAQRTRDAWLAARADARTLSQLETRAEEHHRVELDRREGRELEELAGKRPGFAQTRSLADERSREART